MATKEQPIEIVLLDGCLSGGALCKIDNWNGIAYKQPRKLFAGGGSLIAIKDYNCIYLLFGKTDDDQRTIYVGQTSVGTRGESITKRLRKHNQSNTANWDTAIVFTTLENDFDLSELNYLELAFYKMAVDAGCYVVVNKNTPQTANITEKKVNRMKSYLDYAKKALDAFGYNPFGVM